MSTSSKPAFQSLRKATFPQCELWPPSVDEVKVAALCRTAEQDVARAAEALKYAAHPRIHTFVATSDIHLEHKLRKTRAEVIEMTRAAIRQARNYAEEIEFSAEDATRSDVDYLCEVLDVAVDAGASVLNVPDTVGYTTPIEFTHLVQQVRERVVRDRDVTISVHCHNDLGLAVANSLAAIEAGARQVECTINGIGERAGNASLEEIVMAMHVRADRLPFVTNIKTTRALSDEPTALEHRRFRRATKQSNRWPQRLCARSRNSSTRRHQQSALLRDHDSGIRWRSGKLTGAG